MSEKLKFNCEALIRQLPDPLIVVDRLGKILTVSHAFEEITGYDIDEVVGKNAFKAGFICKDSIQITKKNLLLRFSGKKVPLYDVCVILKDGTKLTAEVNGAMINFSGVMAALSVFRDVTQKRQEIEESTKKLQETTKQLKEKIKELEKMNDLMVGREIKMLELKDKIKELGG